MHLSPTLFATPQFAKRPHNTKNKEKVCKNAKKQRKSLCISEISLKFADVKQQRRGVFRETLTHLQK